MKRTLWEITVYIIMVILFPIHACGFIWQFLADEFSYGRKACRRFMTKVTKKIEKNLQLENDYFNERD